MMLRIIAKFFAAQKAKLHFVQLGVRGVLRTYCFWRAFSAAPQTLPSSLRDATFPLRNGKLQNDPAKHRRNSRALPPEKFHVQAELFIHSRFRGLFWPKKSVVISWRQPSGRPHCGHMRSGGVMPIRFRAVLMVCLVTLVSSRRAARAPMSSSRMRRS